MVTTDGCCANLEFLQMGLEIRQKDVSNCKMIMGKLKWENPALNM